MKKFLLKTLCLLAAATMWACSNDEPDNPTPDKPGNEATPDNPGVSPQESGAIVAAYYPYYSTKQPLVSNVTHINYSFAEVYVTNNIYTGFKVQGPESKFQQIVDLKKVKPDLKILLSFTNSITNSDNQIDGGFSAIAATEANRKQFARDCLTFVQRYNIDGIDLDWEFPGIGWSGAKYDEANDVYNYNLLIKQLRETLGKNYILSFAGYCMDVQLTSKGWRYIDLAAVEPYVDYVFVMTYDLDAAPHFQSAISSPKSYWDVERTVASYKKAGFPMEKMVLGIPFYARHSFSGSNSAITYTAIQQLGADYVIDNWDEDAKTPYITYRGEFWGSYENEKSIHAKAEYASKLGMKGLFYWSVYDDDQYYTLSKATWQAVSKYFK